MSWRQLLVANRSVAQGQVVSVALALLLAGLWTAASAEEFALEPSRLDAGMVNASRGRTSGMRGQVRLGGRMYEVVLIDYDGDGVYGSVSRPRQRGTSSYLYYGDRMALVATIEDGQRLPLPKPKYFFVGKYLTLGDDFHQCDISPDGGRVSIASARVPLGRLRPARERFWMQVISPEVGTFQLYAPRPSPDARELPLDMWVNSVFIKDDGTFELPPGEYHVFRWTMEQVDRAGVKWLYASYDSEVSRPLTIRAGETTDLSFGPPLQAKLTTQGTARAGSSLRFSLALADQRGGRIISVTRDGKLPEPPGLRITDETGRVVATGKFEYG